MSPRAACRLETLGFEHIHDYVPGKADWLAHNLPVERHVELTTAGQLARNDAVTCGLADQVGDVAPRIAPRRGLRAGRPSPSARSQSNPR